MVSTLDARPEDYPEFSTRTPIDILDGFSSSNVHSLLYDIGENHLYARYLRDGADAIYQYWNVPAQTWRGLRDASSKGSYINRNIAYVYRYARLGVGGFPQRGRAIEHPVARRFVMQGITTRQTASHPHIDTGAHA